MKAETVQRYLMAGMLTLILIFWLFGWVNLAAALHVLVIVMLVIWAATDFCPSLWILKKFLPSMYPAKEV